MNRFRHQPSPGVWVELVRGAAPAALCTPHDRAGTSAMPAWRAAEHLAARAVLRSLLRDLFPGSPGTSRADVHYTPKGRPLLEGMPRIGVSVSHDRDAYAACVALGRSVGVDVQHPPTEVADALLRRCVRDGVDDLAALPPARRSTEFSRVWTVQEACVKAAGDGLSGAPWTIDVPPRADSGTWGPYTWVHLPNPMDVPLSCAFSTRPHQREQTLTPREAV